ncbi:hypothetical protein ZTR_07344 [Talaromyces verruculosus]|nr:hypothetical protein ZTR_07344 [Talaromyces verruculosus]
MMVSLLIVLGPALLASYALSFTPCPLLGPAYPPFTLDNNSTILQSALTELNTKFDNLMQTGTGPNGQVTPNTTSFSLALFSTNQGTAADDPFLFEYHYTAPSFRNSTTGVTAVDANSVYRIGGLTEVFTIWSVLIEAGDGVWNNPVTNYVRELKKAAQEKGDGAVDWQSITVGQLTSHMSGISRDFGLGDLSQMQNAIAYGFPGVPTDTVPGCYSQSQCSRAEFFTSLTKQPPVVMPGTSPVYSNDAFQILGYVVESITGKPFETTLSTKILEPLGMNQTTLSTPKKSTSGVIPINETASGWTTNYEDEAPAISMFSSVRDLAIAGKAILSSSLLPTSQTNRWLKPVTHTSNPPNSLGLPWIIYSAGNYPNTSMIDVYTVYDNFGLYSSYLGLVPDYNVGFAILAADTASNADLNSHTDIVGEVIIETLIKIALSNAESGFSGTYTANGLNSSISISVDTLPGMIIDSFISNGTDFRKPLATLYNVEDYTALSIRLYPTHLSSVTESGGSTLAFRAVYQDENEFADAGTPTCVSWRDVDKYRYGGAALDLFIFELNASGEVVSVEIPALRVNLAKD